MVNYRILKVFTHIACWFPLVCLVYGAYSRQLGADPQEEMLHQLGLWTLIYLLIGLTLTPINRVFKLPVLIKFRRMFGLYSFLYLLLHLTVFFIFYLELSFVFLWDEIVERPYITVGMLAALLLIPLVATSTKGMQRKLGRNWKKLHQLVYIISILGITHFIWQSKSDLNEPLLYLIWLILILAYRVVKKYKAKTR